MAREVGRRTGSAPHGRRCAIQWGESDRLGRPLERALSAPSEVSLLFFGHGLSFPFRDLFLDRRLDLGTKLLKMDVIHEQCFLWEEDIRVSIAQIRCRTVAK